MLRSKEKEKEKEKALKELHAKRLSAGLLAAQEEREAIRLLNELAIHLNCYPVGWGQCPEIALANYELRRTDLERQFTALASRRLARVLADKKS